MGDNGFNLVGGCLGVQSSKEYDDDEDEYEDSEKTLEEVLASGDKVRGLCLWALPMDTHA